MSMSRRSLILQKVLMLLMEVLAAQYGFDEEQKGYLADANNSLWSQVLYGITSTDGQIVTVALSQIGNMGGEPYWSWYGFGGV